MKRSAQKSKKLLRWPVMVLGVFLSLCAAQETLPTLNVKNALYLSQALDYLRSHALFTQRVDWLAIQTEANRLARTTTTPTQLYPFLRRVVAQLRDQHSAFETPQEVQRLRESFGMQAHGGYFSIFHNGVRTVVLVVEKSAAFKAGLRPGDAITQRTANLTTEQVTWQPFGSSITRRATFPLVKLTTPLPAVGRDLPHHLGLLSLYSTLPWNTPAQLEKYAVQAQQQLKQVDQQPRCGWILDLRQDLGGNTGAMVLAAGPLLGDGPANAYLPHKKLALRQQFTYRQGVVSVTSAGQPTPLTLRVDKPVALKRPQEPVAVLQGTSTASAAEGLVVAFRGRPFTRFFGVPTYGVPTGNVGLKLPDGAILRVTEGISEDRLGHTYEGPIAPDVVIQEWVNFGTAQDPAIIAASQWLLSQAACHGS